MADEIRAGDKVKCIKSLRGSTGSIQEGKVYTVKTVDTYSTSRWLELVGVKEKWGKAGFELVDEGTAWSTP